MDFEGRNLRIDFNDFSVMSLYLPSGTNDARLNFKLNYMAEFQEYVNELKNEIPNCYPKLNSEIVVNTKMEEFAYLYLEHLKGLHKKNVG